MARHLNPILYTLLTQSILYGIYIATLVSCLRWLLYEDEGWKLRKKVNRPILTVTFLLWAIMTVDLAIFVPVAIDILLSRQHVERDMRILLLLPAIEGITRIITDAVLIYRCWAVHAYSWRIVALPIMLWLSSLVLLALFVYYHLIPAPHNPQTVQSIFLTLFISFHIANNVYGTSAIIYQISRVTKASNFASSRLKRITRILAESGVAYTVSSFLYLGFAAYANFHNEIIFTNCIFDIINFSLTGITFNLILIRTKQEGAKPRNVDSKFVPTGLLTSDHHVPGTANERSSKTS